jgi:hypothetical protein
MPRRQTGFAQTVSLFLSSPREAENERESANAPSGQMSINHSFS